MRHLIFIGCNAGGGSTNPSLIGIFLPGGMRTLSGTHTNPFGHVTALAGDGGRIFTVRAVSGDTSSPLAVGTTVTFEPPATSAATLFVAKARIAQTVKKRAFAMGTPIVLRCVPHGRVLI